MVLKRFKSIIKSNQGVTLVELSIVLVIIGVLVSGVIIGSSYIRTSELQGVIKDLKSYQAAVGNFRDKYGAIPGDLTNKRNFFSIADDHYGNGNGRYDQSSSGSSTDVEGFLAWEHLAKAGLINGDFDGSSTGYQIGVNVPTSKITGSSMNFHSKVGASEDQNIYGIQKNMIQLTGGSYDVGLLSVEDAVYIDNKIDDGEPAKGVIVIYNGDMTAAGCVDQSPESTAVTTLQYGNKNGDCSLAYILQ